MGGGIPAVTQLKGKSVPEQNTQNENSSISFIIESNYPRKWLDDFCRRLSHLT